MKNFEPYHDEYFEIHEKSIDSKECDVLKTSLKFINSDIEIRYGEYKTLFGDNTLELINDSIIEAQSSNDLKSLYGYQKAVIKKLRKGIKEKQIRAIRGTCQNCTINATNSLDHYLPQSQYPEFIVNPLNLFPSCTECNGHKSSNWKENGKRIFLNLYLDKLPEVRYLKTNLSLDSDGEIAVEFELDLSLVREEFKALIENQYCKLHLFERMKNAADEVIAYTETTIKDFSKKIPLPEVINTIEEQVENEREIFGFNHWKSLLKLDLSKSDLFLKSIKVI